MKIGDLSAQAGMPVETIRFYEREGLLPKPSRTTSNYRIYEGHHVERLAFIRHCRSLDMALDEIRALLALQAAPNESCEAVNKVLDEHIEHVAQRIQELTALKRQLVSLRGQCAQAKDVAHCGILSGLGQGEALDQPTGRQHVSASHSKRR